MNEPAIITAGQEAHGALQRRPVPLTEAAQLLAELMERLDAGEDLSSALTEAFHDTRLDLAGAVNRRIAFDAWVKGAIETAKRERDEWRAKVSQLELLHERFKANTKAALEENPDVPFVGTMGKIALQRNPPALKLAFEGKALTHDMMTCFNIPSQYVKTTISYELDTPRLKADIQAGDYRCEWAWVEQASSVRFKK